MSFLTINTEKCKHDGLCVSNCPMGILRLNTADSVPCAVDNAKALCIGCGHCVAICPHGALSIETMAASQCPPIQKELMPSWEQVQQMMQGRRSVRNYKNTPVERAILVEVLNTVRYAPSAHNLQKISWLVIYEAKQVQRLKELAVDWMRAMIAEDNPIGQVIPLQLMVDNWNNGRDRIGHGAPHLIVAHAPKDHPVALIDATIGLTYLELAAAGRQLGACWAGAFSVAATHWQPLQDSLKLPPGNTNCGAMMIGYPKHNYDRIPTRKVAAVHWL